MMALGLRDHRRCNPALDHPATRRLSSFESFDGTLTHHLALTRALPIWLADPPLHRRHQPNPHSAR